MFIGFCISFSSLSTASKTVLNSMLKEPSLIQDVILAQNIQQVCLLNINRHLNIFLNYILL